MTHRSSILLAFLVFGCRTEAPASEPDAAPVMRKVITPVRQAAAVDAPAPDAMPAHAEPAPSRGPVGVAACDEYLAKMARCITHLGAEAAEPMKNAMAESQKAWQDSARTPEGKAALVETCRQALDAARSAAAAMGCQW